MKKIIKRYRIFVILFIINLYFLFIKPEIGKKSFEITFKNLVEMLGIIPPIFILLGLLDIWVKKETIIKFMGKDSGIKGILLSFLMGSTAAGPLYAAFPIAGILLKKGTSIFNVLIFIGAWSTMKIPLLIFEFSSLGYNFTLLRLGLNIIGIPLIAFIINIFLNENDKKNIYQLAKEKE
ncbi:MAG: permease [Fusobacterium perfoetens]|uniref:permease n=1 Tax=Fusobacterium perfoetens TaxID=852 RepID=UPI0023EFFDCC|nr:permease [Fusobacterium perfoetens]MCI6151718.1 permease [Fusobacterium perfoetens]MDY3237834.1 permease [Fusobacterium perfoetens]